jgi:hypothetical protein
MSPSESGFAANLDNGLHVAIRVLPCQIFMLYK